MRRRDVIAASAGVAGGLLSGFARSAVPCPPSPVNVAGGTSATTACVGAAGYASSFDLTENPISEGGMWRVGGAGLDWQNIRTSGGVAYGVGTSAGYNDCIACLPSLANDRHFVQGTIRRRAGYSAPSSHECELLLAFSISAHLARGYEINMWFDGNVQPVRWNGAAGDFTISGSAAWPDSATGPGFGRPLVDGDVVLAKFDSTDGSPLITVHLNGVQVLQIRDTSVAKIRSGAPGMGFFARDGAGVDMTAYCFQSLAAGNA
jgi:hypothetical protein